MPKMKTTEELLTMTNLQIHKLLEDEYIGKDGLIYCKNCHTLRVTKEPVTFLKQRMPIQCKCQKEAEAAEEKKKENERKMRLLDSLRKASLLGKRYENANFATTDLNRDESFVKAFYRCNKYCKAVEKVIKQGYGIYLYGNSKGSGKTHLTACICNELISQYHQCLFTNIAEISKLIRSGYNKGEEAMDRICEIDFLILDDLGTEKLQKNGEDNWLQEQLFNVINKRYNNRKPTIFSSNYSLNELVDRGMAERTVDRIAEMSTAILRVEGESYRHKSRTENAPF